MDDGELHVDVRWLLERQETILGKELAVRDFSGLVAGVARHRVNTPNIDHDNPDAYWRAASLMETLVLLRPLPARNEFFAYGVAVAYIQASGSTIEAPHATWIQLIDDIRGLRLDVFDVADRLRSWR